MRNNVRIDAIFFDEGTATVKLTVRVWPPVNQDDTRFDHRLMVAALREYLDGVEQGAEGGEM